MHPTICQIGPFTVFSYGLMLVIAFLLSTSLLVRQAKKEGLDSTVVFNFAYLIFISGIVGARIFFVLQNIGYYFRNLPEIVMLQRGGMSWFGGLFAGLISGYWYLRKKNIPSIKMLDLIVPFVALGQAIGRIGCLLNGCCYGRISEFGLYFKVHESLRVPTQAYSSLLLLLIFIFLRYLQDRPHKAGQVFFSYLLLYSLKRFFIEFWRVDNPAVILGLTLFQLLCIPVFIIAFFSLVVIARKSCKNSS